MNFIKTDEANTINEFRKELYKTFVAPLDSMWQDLYIASSQAYLIERNKETIGYCCIDGNKSLLQIFIIDENKHFMKLVIKNLIDSKLITSASLNSIEPVSFNACLFHSKSVQPNTYCYEYSNRTLNNNTSLDVTLVSNHDSEKIRTFYKNHVGFDDTFGYVDNLVSRKEVYMALEDDTIIATGECRLSETQIEFADIGVAVNTAFRGKGLATSVLQTLAERAIEAGRKPICSTTIDNIGSQKAIERAGFYCSNIIFDMKFN